MTDYVMVRLRSAAFHDGKRLRPGEIVKCYMDDLQEGRLPSWAEACEQTNRELLAKYINIGDAQEMAKQARRAAEREAKQAEEAKNKADALDKKAKDAERLAADAVKSKNK